MTGTIGDFRIGEDLAIVLEVVDGDPLAVSEITARIKPALVSGNRLALDDAADGMAMQVTPTGTDGWMLSLDHAQTATMVPGLYGIDARLAFGAAVEITERTAFISLSRAALA